jgi:flagellar biosynthesis/type III secretory pathway protein FliH
MILEKDNIAKATRNERDQIELVGEPKVTQKARLYSCTGMPSQSIVRLAQYRDKYDKFLKLHNNTSTKEVWKIYDHVASELLKEQVNTVLQQVVTKDLDAYVEQVIIDEF